MCVSSFQNCQILNIQRLPKFCTRDFLQTLYGYSNQSVFFSIRCSIQHVLLLFHRHQFRPISGDIRSHQEKIDSCWRPSYNSISSSSGGNSGRHFRFWWGPYPSPFRCTNIPSSSSSVTKFSLLPNQYRL